MNLSFVKIIICDKIAKYISDHVDFAEFSSPNAVLKLSFSKIHELYKIRGKTKRLVMFLQK